MEESKKTRALGPSFQSTAFGFLFFLPKPQINPPSHKNYTQILAWGQSCPPGI